MADLLTAGGLILTVLLAYVQIQKQHRANVELQREHLRDQLRTEVYKEVSAAVYEATRAVGRSHIKCITTAGTLRSRLGFPAMPLRTTAEDLNEGHFEGANAFSDVLNAMERYEIVFLRFRSIRHALAEEHSRLLERYSALSGAMSRYLPHRPPDPTQDVLVPPLAQPTAAHLDKLKPLTDDYAWTCMQVQSFLGDLQVEMQNELLSHLFEGRVVPPRNPEDENLRVLTRDPTVMTERPRGRIV